MFIMLQGNLYNIDKIVAIENHGDYCLLMTNNRTFVIPLTIEEIQSVLKNGVKNE